MPVAWALPPVNPAPPRLRRLGRARWSGLPHARSRRCRAAWAPHLARAEDRAGRVTDGLDLMQGVTLPPREAA